MQETWVCSLGKWQPIPVFLPGKSRGQRSLVGYIQSMGSQRVGHNLMIFSFLPFNRFFGHFFLKNHVIREQRCFISLCRELFYLYSSFIFSFSTRVFATVRRKGRSDCVSCRRQRRSPFWPTRNICRTKDSWFVTRLTTASNFGICLL